MSDGPRDLYTRPGRADTGSPRQISATTPAAPPPMAGVSQTPKDTNGDKAAKKNAPGNLCLYQLLPPLHAALGPPSASPAFLQS